VFQGLSVFTIDRSAPRILEHVYAGTARWDGAAWHLEKGWVRTFPATSAVGVYRPLDAPESFPFDPPENFARREMTLAVGGDLPDQMSLEELRAQIANLQNSGYDTTRLAVAFHAKIAQPFTPLVMLLLGLPFAFRVGRSGSLYAVGVSLLLVVVYWATLAVFNALGLETILPAMLAAWAPNVLYGLAGAYLLLWIKT
jgi:lipopolysaccharide export LptBFGC system permease protein LptF